MEQGSCQCTSPFYGPSCELEAACHYWDTEAQAYLTDGCETVAPPLGEDPSLLYCACTHLTDFAGIKVQAYTVPESSEDASSEASAFNVNTFSEDDIADALTNIDAQTVVDNPAAFAIVFGFAGLCALTVALAAWKDRTVWRKVLAERTLEKADADERSRLIAEELERKLDELEDRLDQAMESAASAVQARLRGVLGRRQASGLRKNALAERAAARRKRDHAFTRWVRRVGREIKANHTVLSLCFGDPANQRRAELVQVTY
jgi:hypothetical protein